MGYTPNYTHIRSAGAIVTTWNNQSPVLAGTIVVANNKTHLQILKLLKPQIPKDEKCNCSSTYKN